MPYDSFIAFDDEPFRTTETAECEQCDAEFEYRPGEAAPCPRCGWVQSHMVVAVRKASYPRLRTGTRLGFVVAGAGIALAVGIPAIFFLSNLNNAQKPPAGNAMALAVVGGMVAQLGLMFGCLCWGLRALLNWRYDPNRHFHRGR